MLLQTHPVRRVRQKRAWVSTLEGVGKLSRSARHLAKRSASRINDPTVAKHLRQLKAAIALERKSQLLICDLMVKLIDEDGLRPIDVARQTAYKPGKLSEMLWTARTFPRGKRPAGVTYNYFLMATRMIRKFPTLGYSPRQALDEIRRERLSQHRHVTRHFDRLARAATTASFSMPASCTAEDQGLFDRAYHSRYQDLLGVFPDKSIALLHIDPPYVYRRGMYDSSSARSLECDSSDPESAIGTVVDLLRDWQPKLKRNGVVLLWQPWGSLLPEIGQAIEKYQWEVWGPIIWDKGRPQPGDFSFPYSSQGEMLWMLYRRVDSPINCDGSSRESILRFPPVSFRSLAGGQEHGFQKSGELCQYLIQKHTSPGDLIFDACGCTGTMSVAAIDARRRWVYAESNASNYRLGTSRISKHLAAVREKVAG
jgi:DNA modification methylase